MTRTGVLLTVLFSGVATAFGVVAVASGVKTDANYVWIGFGIIVLSQAFQGAMLWNPKKGS